MRIPKFIHHEDLLTIFTLYNLVGEASIIVQTESVPVNDEIFNLIDEANILLEKALDIQVKIFERKYNIKFWDYAIAIPEYHDDFDRFVSSFAEDFKIIK